jgi:iron complex transport system permease protein
VLALILAGAAVSGLMLAGTALVLNLAPNPYAAYEISHWMMGSLADRGWDQLLLAAPFMLVGTVLLLSTGRALDALSLGERQAASLGVDLRGLRRRVLLGTALAVGAATSVTGAIGFIGLLAPHLVRSAVGYEPRRVLWPAALCGAVLLLIADIATRVLPLDQELKLGVLTGLVGSPFFMWLVWRMKSVSP